MAKMLNAMHAAASNHGGHNPARSTERVSIKAEVLTETGPRDTDWERGFKDGYSHATPESNCSDNYEQGYEIGSNDHPDDGYGESHYTTETPSA